ncbi:hypothetical protein Emag_005764 [Eimeria magna]
MLQPTGRKPAEVDDNSSDPVYEVEHILDSRGSGRDEEFLVKWKGHPDDQATWEPLSNLTNCADVRLEARVELLHGDVKGIGGAVQSVDRQLHCLQERAQVGVVAGHRVELRQAIRDAPAPLRQVGRDGSGIHGHPAQRGERGEASGVSRDGPRFELERAGESERRRGVGSAAVVSRALARVAGGSPAASRVAEVVEAERLRWGRGGVARATTRRVRWALVEARTVRRVATIVRIKPVHQVTWCERYGV